MRNNEGFELPASDADERQLQCLWKGAVWLLCFAILALVMWSGARDSGERCREGDAAARAACAAELRAQLSQPPAKGALSPIGLGAMNPR
jgi:hypothetical protein